MLDNTIISLRQLAEGGEGRNSTKMINTMKKTVFFLATIIIGLTAYTQGGFQKTNISSLADSSYIFVHQPSANTTAIFVDSLIGQTIDTVTISNDSVFIHTQNGDSLFSGLADAPRPNNGRIWYVSKSNENCSINAVIGDPTQPFCNPWQANDSAQSGDLVVVFPGEYTASNTGVADFAFSLANDIRLDYAGNVNYLFYRGAKLDIEYDNSLGVLSVFDVSSVDTLRVDGELSLYSEGQISLIRGTNSDCDAFIKFSDLELYGFSSATMDECYVNGQSFSYFGEGIRFWNADGYLSFEVNTVVDSSSELNLVKCEAKIEVENWRSNPPKSGGLKYTPFGLNYVTFTDKNWSLHIDNYYLSNGITWNTDEPANILIIGFQSAFNNVNVNVEIDNFISADTSNRPLFTFRNSFGGMTLQDTRINYRLGNTKMQNPILHFMNTASRTSNMMAEIECVNCDYTGSNPFIEVTGMSSTDEELYFNGRVRIADAPLLDIANSANVRGNIYLQNVRTSTDSATALIEAERSVLSLSNTTLINNASVAPVISGTAVNVNCMNVYSNSVIVDADVTEQIESIVRDVNVK